MPFVLTLCGSTRFREQFEFWNGQLTLAGHIVFSLGTFGREASDSGKSEDQPLYTEAEKQTLDLVHLRKIMESDAIVVINVDDYIGFSTKREIEWATMLGKKIYHINGGNNVIELIL